MCSGASTCGNSTTLGSGKSRVTPWKLRSGSRSNMADGRSWMSRVVDQIELNRGDLRLIECRVVACDRAEAGAQSIEETVHGQAHGRGRVRAKVLEAACEHLACSVQIAVPKVVQRYGGVDQTLVEQAPLARGSFPDRFPRLVR